VLPPLEGTRLEGQRAHVFNRMVDAAKLRHIRIHNLRLSPWIHVLAGALTAGVGMSCL
jgi:hypothetical protein